jgi:hypothetical protein
MLSLLDKIDPDRSQIVEELDPYIEGSGEREVAKRSFFRQWSKSRLSIIRFQGQEHAKVILFRLCFIII